MTTKRRTVAKKADKKAAVRVVTPRDETPDRQVYVTADGLVEMRTELENLRTDRRAEVADLIQKAKEIGDITDSAQYEAAKEEQAFLEGRIRTLEDVLGRAVLIDENGGASDGVRLGSRVTLLDSEGKEETWTIVGWAESNAAQGRISNESPVGRALIGRFASDQVEVQTPGGVQVFSIVSIG